MRYVLEGSVRKAANRVRIAGQLIDTTTGAHIWGERFDGSLDDISNCRIGWRAASSARSSRGCGAEVERAGRKPTESLDAYDLYLRAQAQAYKRTGRVWRSRSGWRIWPSNRSSLGPAMARIALSRGMQRLRQWIPPVGPEVEEGS